MDIKSFEKLPIMGILRDIEKSSLAPLLDAIIQSGMKTIEITMNTQGAPELIKKTKQIAGNQLAIGAGTVLTQDDLNQALDNGASFMVMPNFIPELVTYCKNRSIPVFPGALTPSEVYQAYQGGATMVKIFPSGLFGPNYFKELKGPFKNIKLMATGGVRENNVIDFFTCGVNAVAVGGSVFQKNQINDNNFKIIQSSLTSLVKAVQKAIS
ncbi:MAG: bifunctional 4-hydroxy-2-oxoglutarate aldolase/2-dehydro-3-deoxy-phosphogluconate aldolase [Candidatus Omnitrophota bacterium]